MVSVPSHKWDKDESEHTFLVFMKYLFLPELRRFNFHFSDLIYANKNHFYAEDAEAYMKMAKAVVEACDRLESSVKYIRSQFSRKQNEMFDGYLKSADISRIKKIGHALTQSSARLTIESNIEELK